VVHDVRPIRHGDELEGLGVVVGRDSWRCAAHVCGMAQGRTAGPRCSTTCSPGRAPGPTGLPCHVVAWNGHGTLLLTQHVRTRNCDHGEAELAG